jgi:ribosome-associated protein
MTSSITTDDIARWARVAARAADAKQGEETVILQVGQVLAITDFFVITGARNTRLVRTIAEEVEKAVKAEGGPAPLRVEGLDQATWVLLDYGDLVVHVFLDETRRFYELERLWRDVPRLAWEPAVTSPAGPGTDERA